jgi:mannose-1-phosphate guanylyltransferase
LRHAVIMAGGWGTRLWPLSRRKRPKHLLRLIEGQSLLQVARRRLENLFDPENIWVVTSSSYLDMVAAELPDIPRANLIGEPVGRDTANVIGLAGHMLALRDPEGTMAVFTADHLISPLHIFADAIRTGLEVADEHPDSLVTFGITPDSPHTGYGYIQRGEELRPKSYRVRAFQEKPTRQTAEAYVVSGDYFWNSGMFCWKLRAILTELERSLPDNHRELAALAALWNEPGKVAERDQRFTALAPISIDFGVMEKARNVIVVEMRCRWLDLGSFSAVARTRRPDEAGNILITPMGLSLGGGDNVLVSESPDHLIAALGVSNIVVVHSRDATLVCHRDHEQQVRELARLCRERYGERYE